MVNGLLLICLSFSQYARAKERERVKLQLPVATNERKKEGRGEIWSRQRILGFGLRLSLFRSRTF